MSFLLKAIGIIAASSVAKQALEVLEDRIEDGTIDIQVSRNNSGVKSVRRDGIKTLSAENADTSNRIVKYCSNCGEQIPEGIKFCPYCGQKIFSKDDEVNYQRESDVWKNESSAAEVVKDMGFSNFDMGRTTTEDTSRVDGGVFQVKVDGHSFEAGDYFKGNEEVYIKYWDVEEPIPNITIESSEEFATLMKLENQTDAATIRKYVNAHIGDVVEFDGCVAWMMNHEDFKTRFDVALVGGNYDAKKVYGPIFAFENVNFGQMNVSGTDTVAGGMNFRIAGEIEGFNGAGGYIILKPVSMKLR